VPLPAARITAANGLAVITLPVRAAEWHGKDRFSSATA